MDILTGLIGQIASKNEGALAELYDRTSRVVYGLALRITGDRPVAEDVTLEVYTEVWKGAGTFEAAQGTVAAWLVTIARNRALDRVREARALVSNADRREDRDNMFRDHQPFGRFLSELPADRQMAIDLALFSGLTQSEIANRMGMSVRTTRAKIHDVMMRFRDQSACLR